eukprot:Tamp_19505.p1 GENE.Tamp_19505~~Tamp_19505.p1  ORF type:complete len:187 (+),score=40.15 Tamp_19505:65-562(+)
MSFNEARGSMHPSVREPAVMSLSAPGVGRSRHVGSDMMMMDSLHGMLTHAGGAARLGGGARSRVVGGGSTVRPGTAGFDEYQALQMLDEDVVKRGVSDRRMRSFREAPVPRQCVGKDKCDVCQFEYAASDRVIHLPCKHMFHSGCIKEWFKEQRTCPVCRFEVEA